MPVTGACAATQQTIVKSGIAKGGIGRICKTPPKGDLGDVVSELIFKMIIFVFGILTGNQSPQSSAVAVAFTLVC